MAFNTKPLEKVIDVWRELNAERVEAMTAGDEDKVAELNSQENFRLRDIAGEAMQLVEEIKLAGQAEE